MSLAEETRAFKATWTTRVGAETAALVAGDIEELRPSGILDRAAKEGDVFPALALPDHTGALVTPAALAARGPVVLTFYRGGWCPYCNLELRAYQARLEEIVALGGRLIAVSPEAPDHTAATIEKNDLSFQVLSDRGGALADALGIRFPLTDAIIALYKRFGHDLPAHNADGAWTLPIPATYVIGRDGRVALAHVEPDYRLRLDPERAIEVLRRIGSARPAASR